LFEVDSICSEKQQVVDPREGLAQRAGPELDNEAQQLADRVLQRRAEGDGVVVTMDDGVWVVLFEVAFERPVVGKAEGDEGVGCLDGIERNDIAAVIRTADAHQRFAGDRPKVRKLDRAADLGPDIDV